MNFTGTDFDDPTPFGGFGKFKSSNAFKRAGKTAVKTQELENQLAGDGIEGRAKLRHNICEGLDGGCLDT